jgi:membrane protein implicated in regulation of membrane protease activity
MLNITNPWIFLIIGFVLIGLTALEFQGMTFVISSVIAFVMSLYFTTRDIEEPKQVGF